MPRLWHQPAKQSSILHEMRETFFERPVIQRAGKRNAQPSNSLHHDYAVDLSHALTPLGDCAQRDPRIFRYVFYHVTT